MQPLKIAIIDLHGWGKKSREGIEYVGRRGQYRTWPASVLANPFTKKEHGEAALTKYKDWLDKSLFYAAHLRAADATATQLELRRLLEIARSESGLKIGCWCCSLPDALDESQPVVCHAQLIAKKLAEMDNE